jgi:hypothetical protein
MHTQRIYEHHESESQLSCINSELLYMESATQLSASPLCSSSSSYNVTIHNEGVYILFPSCALKLSNLDIQFYLLALTTINAFYLLRTRANRSRSIYIIQVRSFLMASFKVGISSRHFKICVGCLSSCLLTPRWLA